MESAFGVEHGEISKGVGGLLKTGWKTMSTAEKVGTVGGSAGIAGGAALYNKKKTGRLTGNGGLVGLGARKTGLGYQKRPV